MPATIQSRAARPGCSTSAKSPTPRRPPPPRPPPRPREAHPLHQVGPPPPLRPRRARGLDRPPPPPPGVRTERTGPWRQRCTSKASPRSASDSRPAFDACATERLGTRGWSIITVASTVAAPAARRAWRAPSFGSTVARPWPVPWSLRSSFTPIAIWLRPPKTWRVPLAVALSPSSRVSPRISCPTKRVNSSPYKSVLHALVMIYVRSRSGSRSPSDRSPGSMPNASAWSRMRETTSCSAVSLPKAETFVVTTDQAIPFPLRFQRHLLNELTEIPQVEPCCSFVAHKVTRDLGGSAGESRVAPAGVECHLATSY